MNIDNLRNLYEEDPVKFEEERNAIINATISKASSKAKDKLIELQERIDIGIASCDMPTKGSIKTSRGIVEYFLKLNNKPKPV